MNKLIMTLAVILFFSCQNNAQSKEKQQAVIDAKPIEVPIKDGKAKAYFASGCFWCVEAVFESVKGVEESISGYAGGHTNNPTYQSTSNSYIKDHAEAVEVIYDPKIVSFETLVDVYFASQNPTQVNGQGPDKGYQYRSIIFYQNEAQKKIIEKKKAALAKKLNAKIAAEVYPFQKFWVGEDYHQDYEKRNPNQSYIRNVSIPRLNRFKAKMPQVLKENH
ncbi:peptide-methionine (S)-S-oxide reductase MsrA [Psychroserpens sp. SPM9]|uniref:peptide-methionine (S)-S-oxide reductase MsrA n=1 Tax=Psychroserpens sp. SPM9 TaxID=2975598 RepID=UPI0021A6FD0B|nr:peptide-methionine (S)-S-oxide reductase MsrA [Psychroserpens sp. SPM9]MDG5492803.1 peptide-methionine (S)-S-oxide reductase MsrA [Psychroserpens sp. SPM9]